MLAEKVRLLEQENKELKFQMERMKQLCGNDGKLMRCEQCTHFVQYFVKCGSSFRRIDEGSCTAGRRFKKKRAEDERCQFFQDRDR